MGIYVFVVQMRWIAGVGYFGLVHPHLSPLPSRERGILSVVLDLLSPSPRPVDSRVGGNDGLGVVGVGLLCAPRHAPPLWIADQVRNDVTPFPALWIDESWMMFFEHLVFHPKGESALSFSS